jgi:hypothetical protein
MFRKFFNADAVDAPAATETQAPEVASIASLMATAGQLNITGEQAEMPTNTVTEAAPAEVQTDDAVTAAEGAAEAQAATETAAVETQQEAAPIVAAPIAAPTWQEVLKKEQPDTVLKELGFDEKVVSFLNHWKNGGDLKEYLQEMSTDYSKMPAEEVMRHQLRLDYPKASDAQLDILYRKKVVEAYRIGEYYDEDEAAEGRLLLEAEAEKYREGLVQRQQKYLLPSPPEAAPSAPDTQALEQQQLIDNSKKSVVESPLFRQVLANNKLTIGEGDEAFSFPVNANELPEIIYDPAKFVESIFKVSQDASGRINLQADPEHQLLVAAVAKHGKGLLIELAKHYKAIGGKKAVEPIENASVPNGAKPAMSEAAPSSPAAAMAKFGKLSWS